MILCGIYLRSGFWGFRIPKWGWLKFTNLTNRQASSGK